MEKTILAQSFAETSSEAIKEIKEKFSDIDIKAITFFASSKYSPAELNATMNAEFPNIPVFGCSTAGEIISGNMTTGSIVAMAFTDELIEDIKVEVIDKINEGINLQPVVQSFEDHFSTNLNSMDTSKYFGLIYMDGLSKKEEVILDEIGNYTNVVFIGGSAADDFKYDTTIIYANGNYYENAALLALAKSKVAFKFEKIQSFDDTGIVVVATKVDEKNRLIYEFNNKPAAEVLSEIINVPIEQFSHSIYSQYSLGLFIDGQPYMRDIRSVINHSTLELYCSVKENMQVRILKTSDIIKNTKNSWEQIKKKYNGISNIMIFNCVLRVLELHSEAQIQEYTNIFDVPTIGFCTYGEALIGHINRTATLLIFLE